MRENPWHGRMWAHCTVYSFENYTLPWNENRCMFLNRKLLKKRGHPQKWKRRTNGEKARVHSEDIKVLHIKYYLTSKVLDVLRLSAFTTVWMKNFPSCFFSFFGFFPPFSCFLTFAVDSPTFQLALLYRTRQVKEARHRFELLLMLHHRAVEHTLSKALSILLRMHELTDTRKCHCDWQPRKSMPSCLPRQHMQIDLFLKVKV